MTSQHAELAQRIAVFDLDEPGAEFTFTDKLAKENGWSRDYAKRTIEEYKRFAFLAIAAGHPVSPSDQVDQVWHLHLTYTQSYWDRFCRDVLRTPLHHNPSKGGRFEQEKFVGWYNQTLVSYRRFFEHDPPADIWPPAANRFGADLHHRRVNTTHYWIIHKPPLKWLVASAVLVLSGLLTLAGCVSKEASDGSVDSAALTATIPNPFDLPGPQFLTFFVVGFAIAFFGATLMRSYFCSRSDSSSPEVLKPDPYEVAYLAGGQAAAVNAALANLVSRGALKVEGEWLRFSQPKDDLSATPLHAFERATLETINATSGATVDEVHRHSSPLVEAAERLKSFGLIVSDECAWLGRWLPLLIAISVPCLGAIRILDSSLRDKPVGFLMVGCVVAVSVALGAFGRTPHRTRQGDRLVERLRLENAALESNGNGGRSNLSEDNLALAVGLFGIGVLGDGPLAELHSALKQRKDSGGAGYVGGGGGGCGGGCGGCGGCGG